MVYILLTQGNLSNNTQCKKDRCYAASQQKKTRRSKNLDILTGLNEFNTTYLEGFIAHMEEEKLAEVMAKEEMSRNLAQVEAVAVEVDLEVLWSSGDGKHHLQTPVLAHVQEHAEFCEAHTDK